MFLKMFSLLFSIFPLFFLLCVSFHLLLFFKKNFFTFGAVKGNARDGRSRHRPTNQSRVCKVNLATRNVAIKAAAMDRIGRDEDGSQFGERLAASTWICIEAVICNGLKHMDVFSNWVGDGSLQVGMYASAGKSRVDF